MEPTLPTPKLISSLCLLSGKHRGEWEEPDMQIPPPLLTQHPRPQDSVGHSLSPTAQEVVAGMATEAVPASPTTRKRNNNRVSIY